MSTGDEQDARSKHLEEIADLLGIPSDELLILQKCVDTELGQTVALLRAFSEITDPEVRASCLETVKACAASNRHPK